MAWYNNNNIAYNYRKDSNNEEKNNKNFLSSNRYNNFENNFMIQKKPNGQINNNIYQKNSFGQNNILNNYDNNGENNLKKNKSKISLSRSWNNIPGTNFDIINEDNKNSFNSVKSLDKIPKGLDNIGATCYMNATLQCFYHCAKLTNYIISQKYIKDNIRIKNHTISSEYINLIKELNKKDGKVSYAPQNFKDILGIENPLFRGIQANDSKDLILFLEQTLARELTVPENNNIANNNISYFQIDQKNEQNVLNYFIEDFKKERSIIKDLFYFTCKTKSECLKCHIPIYNFQVSNFLIFPLEKTYYDFNPKPNNNINNSMPMNNYNNNDINSLISQSMNNMNASYNMSSMNMNMMMNMMMNMNTMNMNNYNNYNYTNNNSIINSNNNLNNYYRNNAMSNNNNFSNNFFNNFNFNNNNNNSNNNNNNNNRIINYNSYSHNKNSYDNKSYSGNHNKNFNNNNNYSSKDNNIYKKKKSASLDIHLNNNKKYNSNKRTSSFNNDIFNQNFFNNNFNSNQNCNYPKNDLNRFLLGSGPNDHSLSLNNNNKPKVTLNQCFESYLKPEKLCGDNQQYCNNCRGLNESYYTTSIYSSSNILILILNYGKGILFECDVDFDEKINISKFVESKGGPVNYRLLGIIVHIGPSSMSGHFIAFCRGIDDKEQWYKLNDSIVTKATFSDIKKAGMPYVLFYENADPYLKEL